LTGNTSVCLLALLLLFGLVFCVGVKANVQAIWVAVLLFSFFCLVANIGLVRASVRLSRARERILHPRNGILRTRRRILHARTRLVRVGVRILRTRRRLVRFFVFLPIYVNSKYLMVGVNSFTTFALEIFYRSLAHFYLRF